MSKMKKALLMGVAYVLVAVIAIGGTLAYLQAEDSDVNVMTMGNVKIEQFEYERVVDDNGDWVDSTYTGYGYTADLMQEFQNDKPAYPAVYQDGDVKWDDRNGSQAASGDESHQQPWSQVGAQGSNQLFDDSVKNVIDKFVFVKNTGVSDAYYRTYIAIEWPESLDADLLHLNFNSNSRFTKTKLGTVEHEGVDYLVYEMLYNEILTPGEVSRPSLLQLFLDPKATNEDCAQFGDEWRVIAFSQAVQAAGFEDAGTALYSAGAALSAAKVALDTAFGEPMTINAATENELVVDWIFNAVSDYEASLVWDGTVDTAWYNETDTTFTLTSAAQIAGLAELVDGGNTFEGKTVLLDKDVNLHAVDADGNPISFNPIGSYRHDAAFKGTFDGQDHTIANMYQSGWALDNDYYSSDLGLGLFGLVEDATVKNVNIDGAEMSTETNLVGSVAGAAYGDTTFENITVTNTKMGNYQYYSGGIVGWASGNHQYINCDVDETNVIASQWGDFDNSNGGLIGGCGGSSTIYLKDCDVACVMDVYNDVTSSYRWYAYRRCGMLIGNTGKTATVDGTTYAAAPQLTAENCTVTYGAWADYTYCEFAGQSWPYVRVQAGYSTSAYSNPRYGVAVDANGNKAVDDTHVHNDGEDHNILCTFDQLYGGGQGVYGAAAHDGVTVVYKNK